MEKITNGMSTRDKELITALERIVDLKAKYLEDRIDLKAKHLEEIMNLRSKMSDTAILKAEAALFERLEASNGKFALLKEQAVNFATKDDLKSITSQLAMNSKMIYIGVGALLVIEFVIKYFDKF